MTVIAYKNGILASDTAVWSRSVCIGHVEKIIRTPGGIMAGSCGDSVSGDQFRQWVLSGRKKRWEPPSTEIEAIVIEKDGTVTRYYGASKTPYTAESPFYAIGCGYELALGAMAAGATAEDAVKIAIKYHSHCGGKVIILKR